MSNTAGILLTQLTTLDSRAEALEKMILKDITTMHNLPESKQTEAVEQRIIFKAWQLDAIQDQIDEITAKLKSNGWYQSKVAGDVKYIYRQPKIKKVATPKKKERKVEKVYSTLTTQEQKREIKKKEAQKRAQAREEAKAIRDAEKAEKRARIADDRVAAQEDRKLARTQRLGEKSAPKPRRPKECEELFLAKKRRDAITARINKLDRQIEGERIKLEQRLVDREARVAEVADIPATEMGHQKRLNARKALENVQYQLDNLPNRREERLRDLTDQLTDASTVIEKLTKLEEEAYRDLLIAAGY